MSNMEIYVDGGCRGNGTPNAIGAAAAVFMTNGRVSNTYVQRLPAGNPAPTSQRAELTAMMIALRTTLSRRNELPGSPFINVKVYADSTYAIGCMSQWINTWRRNGFINANNQPVANKDLVRAAGDLLGRVEQVGRVEFVHIPRDQNRDADRVCNEVMDEMHRENNSSHTNAGSWFYSA